MKTVLIAKRLAMIFYFPTKFFKSFFLVLSCLLLMCELNSAFANKNDSLRNIVAKSKSDSVKMDALLYLTIRYEDRKNDTCLVYVKSIEEVYNKNKKVYFQLHLSFAKGMAHYLKKEYESCVKECERALSVSKSINDTLFQGNILYKLSRAYSKLGKYDLTIQAQLDGIRFFEKRKNFASVATFYNNMAIAYNYMGDYQETINALKTSLKYNKEVKAYASLHMQYINMGDCYILMNKPDSAIMFLDTAIQTNLRYNVQDSGTTHFIEYWKGEAYYLKGDYTTALKYYKSSHTYRLENSDKDDHVYTYIGIGKTLHKLNRNNESQTFLKAGLALAYEVNAVKRIAKAHLAIADLYFDIGNYKESVINYKKSNALRDSMFNDEKTLAIMSSRTKFQVEAKDRAIELLNAKSILAEQRKKIADEQLKTSQSKLLLLFSVLGFSGILIGSLFWILKKRNKTNKLLQYQRDEIYKSHGEISNQKAILEEKNREITDSIRYAKRLQDAILPTSKLVKEYLNESFVLYKPKDIVAGDFYWMETATIARKAGGSDTILFAAADCTGHGVPGAMVSVVCHNALNRAVKEFGLTEPGAILDKTSEIVISEFEKSHEDVKDGMDIALCSITYSKLKENNVATLKYSGANNPLWLVRNVNQTNEIEKKYQFEEIKPDKQPIGNFSNPKPFTTHETLLKKGDSIYIFTDGYQDQFGGEKSKKFMAQQLKTLILEIQSQSMEEQRERLNNVFENWKGSLEQVDDICFIGVRV